MHCFLSSKYYPQKVALFLFCSMLPSCDKLWPYMGENQAYVGKINAKFPPNSRFAQIYRPPSPLMYGTFQHNWQFLFCSSLFIYAFPQGCEDALTSFIRDNLLVVASVAITFVVAEVRCSARHALCILMYAKRKIFKKAYRLKESSLYSCNYYCLTLEFIIRERSQST